MLSVLFLVVGILRWDGMGCDTVKAHGVVGCVVMVVVESDSLVPD